MVSRTPGPFEFYGDKYDGTTGDTIRADVDPVDINARNLGGLAQDLQGDERRIVQEVEGDIQQAVTFSPSYSSSVAHALMGSAYFATGCLRLFASDVDDFDTSVDGLNIRYNSGVDTINHDASLHPDVDVPAAKAALLSNLRPEYTKAETTLDDDADAVAAKLKKGPNPADVKQLMLMGLLPLSTLSYFPDVSLTDTERHQAAVGSARLLMEHLRRLGLLTGPTPAQDSLYFRWLVNSAERGVDPSVIEDFARNEDIRPDDFDVLAGAEEITDPDGKSYFLLPDDISGDDARRAVLMTYVFNAGTDYAASDPGATHDFTETPYSTAEYERISARQGDNDWSYDDDVGFVNGNGGRLATTPNGMMMGLGGNFIQDLYSQKGGTTYGDIFMLNIDDPDDAAQTLRDVIHHGDSAWEGDDGLSYGNDLDRVLHHEERHSQQWADKGYTGMIWDVIWDEHSLEEDAGLHDGGYE